MKQPVGGGGRFISKLLFILSLLFLGFGLVNLGWAVWPAPTEAVLFTIPEGVLPGAPAGATYASLADYSLAVSWPRWLRAGEGGNIKLTLNEIENESPNVRDRPVQIVMAEASMGSLAVEPSGLIQTSLGAGQDLEYWWAVSGDTRGEYHGEVMIAFGFYDEILDDLVPVPIAVVDVAIQVRALWGMEVGLVLWFGVIGLVLWGALFLLGRVAQER